MRLAKNYLNTADYLTDFWHAEVMDPYCDIFDEISGDPDIYEREIKIVRFKITSRHKVKLH